jgi:glycosyltransferase involved in cell wall biosynthesis
VFHEIYEDAVLFFNPNDPDSLSQAMLRIVTDMHLRRNLIMKGKRQAAKYSWKHMAKKTMEMLEKV